MLDADTSKPVENTTQGQPGVADATAPAETPAASPAAGTPPVTQETLAAASEAEEIARLRDEAGLSDTDTEATGPAGTETPAAKPAEETATQEQPPAAEDPNGFATILGQKVPMDVIRQWYTAAQQQEQFVQDLEKFKTIKAEIETDRKMLDEVGGWKNIHALHKHFGPELVNQAAGEFIKDFLSKHPVDPVVAKEINELKQWRAERETREKQEQEARARTEFQARHENNKQKIVANLSKEFGLDAEDIPDALASSIAYQIYGAQERNPKVNPRDIAVGMVGKLFAKAKTQGQQRVAAPFPKTTQMAPTRAAAPAPMAINKMDRDEKAKEFKRSMLRAMGTSET